MPTFTIPTGTFITTSTLDTGSRAPIYGTYTTTDKLSYVSGNYIYTFKAESGMLLYVQSSVNDTHHTGYLGSGQLTREITRISTGEVTSVDYFGTPEKFSSTLYFGTGEIPLYENIDSLVIKSSFSGDEIRSAVTKYFNSDTIYGYNIGSTFDESPNYINDLGISNKRPFSSIYVLTSQFVTLMEYWITSRANLSVPITYYPIHSNLSGPSEANIGDTVEVDVSFPDGYKLKNATQGSGISVYNDNGYIDYTYDESTGKLRFTMPN